MTWGTDFRVDDQGTGMGGQYFDLGVNSSGLCYVIWNDQSWHIYVDTDVIGGSFASTSVRIDNSTVSCDNPSIALDDFGYPVATWTDGRLPNPPNIFSDQNSGSGWGSDTQVNIGTASALNSNVDVDSTGSGYALWIDYSGDASGNVYSRQYSGGSWVPGDQVVDGGGSSEVQYPEVAVDPTSGYPYAVWRDDRDGLWNMYFSEDTGGGWSAPSAIDTGTMDISFPGIEADGDGNLYAIWLENSDVYFRYRPSGGTWGTTETVTTGGTAGYPDIVVGSDGTAHVVWIDSSSDYHVYYSYRMAPDSWSSYDIVDTNPAGDSKTYPHIGVDSSGRLFVIWEDYRNSDMEMWGNYYQ